MPDSNANPSTIAVVVPCYRVKRQVLSVLEEIGPEVAAIYLVDDCCPDKSGEFVEDHTSDPRVRVIYHERNQGVGGATMTGMRQAVADGADVVIKVDGDGQMDPRLIPLFAAPVLSGDADYAKGNRFFDVRGVESMPMLRKIGNLALSFFTKFSSGYWHIFDPTNGYIAIHAKVVDALPLDKIARRYFFESDMLFRLNTIGAVICDIPMSAKYAGEQSNMKILPILPEFLRKHCSNAFKRIAYNYFLKDFNIASIELSLGVPLLLFGFSFGITKWILSMRAGVVASAGTVMVAALSILLATQLLLSFLNFDVSRYPTIPLQKRLDKSRASLVKTESEEGVEKVSA